MSDIYPPPKKFLEVKLKAWDWIKFNRYHWTMFDITYCAGTKFWYAVPTNGKHKINLTLIGVV